MNNNVSEKIIRVALYIRVSTEEQKRKGYSVDSQLKRLKEFSKENNYKVIDVYVDEAKSARSKLNSRKDLLRLLDDSGNDKFDRIVFWRLDRWIRNVADYYKVQEILNNNHVDWECSDEEYDTYTTNGRLYLNIKLSIAQNESDQTGDRIKFNFENMLKMKKPIHGSKTYPYGYCVGGEGKNKVVIRDKNVEHIVYAMFDYFENCGSIRKTTKYINQTYNAGITYKVVNRCLTYPLFYGKYKDIEDYCQPYITKERFDKIQTLVKHNNKDNTKKHDYIFSGLLKCPECGKNLGGSTLRHIRKSGKVYTLYLYRCVKNNCSGLCTNNKTIREDILEDWLLNNFESELKKYITAGNISDKDNDKNKKYDKKNINNILKKIERLNDLYIEGKISKDKYDNNYNQYNKEINEIKNHVEIERDLTKYNSMLSELDVFDLYNKLDGVSKNVFWKQRINYITYNNDTKDFEISFK